MCIVNSNFPLKAKTFTKACLSNQSTSPLSRCNFRSNNLSFKHRIQIMQLKQDQYSTERKLCTDLGSNFPDAKPPYGFNRVEHFSFIGFLRE